MNGDARSELARIVRELEVRNGDRIDDLEDESTEQEVTASRAELISRFREHLHDRVPAPSQERAKLPFHGLRWLPLSVVTALLIATILLPGSAVLPTLLFGVSPALLVILWTVEAYHDPGLYRLCQLISQRAHFFRVMRRDLDNIVSSLDRLLTDPSMLPLRERLGATRRRVVAAREQSKELTEVFRRGSRAASSFADSWRSEPSATRRVYQTSIEPLQPRAVDAAIADLMNNLRQGEWSGTITGGQNISAGRAGAVEDEITAIARRLATVRSAVVSECQRFYRCFNTVHLAATVYAEASGPAPRAVRVAALLALAVGNLFTLSPADRTQRRARFHAAAGVAGGRSWSNVRDSVSAMRRVG